MKVKELIAELSLRDPEATVAILKHPDGIYGDVFVAEDDVAYGKTLMRRTFMMRLRDEEVPEEEQIKIVRLGRE